MDFKKRFITLLACSLMFSGCSKEVTTSLADGGTGTKSISVSPVLPLPTFKSCSDKNAPTVPAKWQTGALLQHFSDTELYAANLTYDQAASALRFTLAEMSGKYADFLLTDQGLFRLGGGFPKPSQCNFIGKTSLKVPPRQWVDSTGLCVGEAPVTGKDLSWWKTKVSSMTPAGADWYWFDKQNNNLPYRVMFSKPTPDFGILGMFTFDYFANFQAVDNTNLQSLKSLCGTPQNADIFVDANNISALFKSNSQQQTLNESTLGEWVPGLEQTSAELPRAWPNKVQGTTFMTSVNYCYAPFPTRVYYDWDTQAQNTSMYWNTAGAVPQGCTDTNSFYFQEALLLGNLPNITPNKTGYIFNNSQQGEVTECLQVLPGPQVPNWKVVDGCKAKAQLAPGSVFNPTDEIVKILNCPISRHVDKPTLQFWTWYSVSGAPMVFMQSNSNTQGTGLNLADYYAWQPGAQAPSGTFDLPTICKGQPKHPVDKGCHNCHLPTN